jgi:hypothetical protein
MLPLRSIAASATTLVVVALAAVSLAQELPPIPNKTLPVARPPGGAVGDAIVSPRTGFAYAFRVEPKEFDSDEGESAEEMAADPSTSAPSPLAAAVAPEAAAAASGIPKSEFYKNGLPKGARRAAKLSIANAPIETFNDLTNLLATLPSKQAMVNHNPPITTQTNSNRVAEEKRNVRVKCWLYAASHEDDNDYHLILGRAPGLNPKRFMTMEVSGLPPTNFPSFPALKGVRDSYNMFFSGRLPGDGYDFYPTPIPVLVEGSLFFDRSHATGTPPGPQSLRPNMPTIWEVHPITRIVFEPNGPPPN